MGIREWFWRLLPDKCEMRDCRRNGVRGNENVLPDGTIICDGCGSRRHWAEEEARGQR